MAIFKNEEEYMEEWLDHHIEQGITHFYLYCNDPLINKYSFLLNNKYNKYITLIPWVNKKNNGKKTIQRQAYKHCVQTFCNECQYIMMLDIDEFIINKDKNKRVIEFFDFINSNNNNIKAIKVPRFDFGSDGHINKPMGGVIGNYKKREKVCSSYKTIANSDFIDKEKDFYGVHDFYFLRKPGKIYNSYFSYKYSNYNGPNKCDKNSINDTPLEINHYYTKSYEEFMKRCKLWRNGGVNTVGYRKNCKNTFFENEKKFLK